jgi:hypothetical protein
VAATAITTAVAALSQMNVAAEVAAGTRATHAANVAVIQTTKYRPRCFQALVVITEVPFHDWALACDLLRTVKRNTPRTR